MSDQNIEIQNGAGVMRSLACTINTMHLYMGGEAYGEGRKKLCSLLIILNKNLLINNILLSKK